MQPEYDGSDDADGGEGQLATSVIAAGEAALVLQAGEKALDPVTSPSGPGWASSTKIRANTPTCDPRMKRS